MLLAFKQKTIKTSIKKLLLINIQFLTKIKKALPISERFFVEIKLLKQYPLLPTTVCRRFYLP